MKTLDLSVAVLAVRGAAAAAALKQACTLKSTDGSSAELAGSKVVSASEHVLPVFVETKMHARGRFAFRVDTNRMINNQTVGIFRSFVSYAPARL